MRAPEILGRFPSAENWMEKTEKNKNRDRMRLRGKTWIDQHVPYKDRKSGSGLRFGGRYVEMNED